MSGLLFDGACCVVARASAVSDGSRVTKRTGAKLYTLRRELKIYMERNAPPQIITAPKGAAFLVDARGNAEAVPPDTHLVWHVDPQELLELLEEKV